MQLSARQTAHSSRRRPRKHRVINRAVAAQSKEPLTPPKRVPVAVGGLTQPPVQVVIRLWRVPPPLGLSALTAVAARAGSLLRRAPVPSPHIFVITLSLKRRAVIGAAERAPQVIAQTPLSGILRACAPIRANTPPPSTHAKPDDDVAPPPPILNAAGQVGLPVVTALTVVKTALARLRLLAALRGARVTPAVVSVPAGQVRA